MPKTRLEQFLKIKATNFISYLQNNSYSFCLKIFFLLLGFFNANTLSTILGQIAHWDILIAILLSVMVECIGLLIYQIPNRILLLTISQKRRQKNLFLLNVWKIGFTYALFVDSFKVGS
uniref:Ycf20 n=1 Tax=Nitellopsis obtusa TaxID=40811 RepID=A0A8F6YEX0_9VIRI|nr:hypothetical protein RF20 [Nitellopsis obtusa]QXT44803.1 hypothetical protein RF20 [Nitellopsis obtusa]